MSSGRPKAGVTYQSRKGALLGPGSGIETPEQADRVVKALRGHSCDWGSKTDSEFLHWLAERLVNVYGENPNVDFLHRLRAIADRGDQ